MPSQLLDMRDCESSEFTQIYAEISKAANLLQPVWFRPIFAFPAVRCRLGFDWWSRKWEYPWSLLNADMQAGLRVLDIGSGGSPLSVYLGRMGYECYAADPCLDKGKSVESWRGRFLNLLGIVTAWGLPAGFDKTIKRSVPVSYYSDSIQELSFPDSFFDRVFCISVMEHIPETEWSFSMNQLARVVKHGGKLILTFDMSTPYADARAYERLITACPLNLVGSVEYEVPIPDEDKRLRHPGHTYETVGLVWDKI
jgi:SAM-dependent methyltransferase